MPTPESNLLDAARAYLSSRQGGGWRVRRVILEAEGPDGVGTEIVLRQGRTFGAAETDIQPDTSATGPDIRPLTPTEQAIVDALQAAGRPLKGSVIGHKLGKPESSYLRGLLGKMVRDGLLIKMEGGGYWLPGRQCPAA